MPMIYERSWSTYKRSMFCHTCFATHNTWLARPAVRLRTECTYLQNKREGCTYCCLGSLLTVFCFAFSWKFNELQLFMSRFADFFPPRQNTEKLNSRIADKSPTKQNIGQAHGMSRVHRVSPPPLYGIDQGHPQRHSQAMAGRRKRRASRDLVVDGFVARQVVYSYAREARSPL